MDVNVNVTGTIKNDFESVQAVEWITLENTWRAEQVPPLPPLPFATDLEKIQGSQVYLERVLESLQTQSYQNVKKQKAETQDLDQAWELSTSAAQNNALAELQANLDPDIPNT